MARKKQDEVKQPEVVGVEKVVSGTVGEALAGAVEGGASLVMLENEKLFSIAVQRPRDEQKILDDLLAIIKKSPVFAEDAIYSKPVGKEYNQETGKYDGAMKYAEGFSIRFAEEMRRLYGNNGVAATISGEHDDGTIVAGVFVDYERGTRMVITRIAPRSYTTRSKQTIMHPPDRYADIVIPKTVSIVMREVINRSTPAWIKAEAEVAIRSKRNKVKPEVRKKKVIDAFAKLGVPEDALSGYLNKSSSEWKHRDLDILQGLGVAIRDGDMNTEEVFGIKGKKAPEQEEKKGPLTPKQEPVAGPPPSTPAPAFDRGAAEKALNAAKDKPALDLAWNTLVRGKAPEEVAFELAEIYNQRVVQIPG